MLTNQPFYHGTTRKLVVAFGGIFNNVHIRTRDKDGSTQKIVKVPIAFAQKEKFVIRLQQDPGLQEDIQVLLPRLAFELTGYNYDSGRQVNKMNRKMCAMKDGTVIKTFAPVPYNVSFNLYSFTRTTEDNLQIMEQVLPFFTPDMNLSIKMLADPEVVLDVPLILNSVNTDDEYDGGFEERRYIITTYSFTMKAFFYGPLLGSEDIVDDHDHFENVGNNNHVVKRVVVDLNNQVKYTATVDPFAAGVNDPHNVIEGWTDL